MKLGSLGTEDRFFFKYVFLCVCVCVHVCRHNICNQVNYFCQLGKIKFFFYPHYDFNYVLIKCDIGKIYNLTFEYNKTLLFQTSCRSQYELKYLKSE